MPSLTWCDNGDMLATAFTAPFDRSTQMAILITRLRAGRQRWDAPALFFIASDRNVTSAALYHAPDGEIHHYNGLGGFSDARKTAFSMLKRTSRDNGATWSRPRIVHEYPACPASPATLTGEPRLWPHMDIVRLEDGTLIMPSDSGPGQDQGSVGSVLFESHDDGETWTERTRFGWHAEEYAEPGGQAGWIAGIHAPLVVLKDGRWLALGRGNNLDDHAPWSQSSDQGRTWNYAPSQFPPLFSGQRPVMLRLQEGPIMLVSFTGPLAKGAEPLPIAITDAAGKTRTYIGMFAALSYDEGRTWPRIKLVPVDAAKPEESDAKGYLSCLQTPDRMIHLLSSRRYYRFNLAWLEIAQP
ncbi:MAG: sialidase family protein [Kiritimatiellia bacterium]